jgi:hypothetical protein
MDLLLGDGGEKKPSHGKSVGFGEVILPDY